MFYNVLLCCCELGRCGVSTVENVTDTEITAVGNVGVSTLEDGTVDNEISPPNE